MDIGTNTDGASAPDTSVSVDAAIELSTAIEPDGSEEPSVELDDSEVNDQYDFIEPDAEEPDETPENDVGEFVDEDKRKAALEDKERQLAIAAAEAQAAKNAEDVALKQPAPKKDPTATKNGDNSDKREGNEGAEGSDNNEEGLTPDLPLPPAKKPPPPAPPLPQGSPVKAPKPKKPKNSKQNTKPPTKNTAKPAPPSVGGAQSTTPLGSLLNSINDNEYLKDKIEVSDVEARLRRTDQNLNALDASESLRAGVLHQDFKDHIDGVEAKINADKPFAEQLNTRNAMRGTLTDISRDMHNNAPALDKFTEFSQDPYAMKVSPEQNSALFKSLEDAPLGARQYVFSEMRSEIDKNPEFGFDDAVASTQKSLGQFDAAYGAINPDAESTLDNFNNDLDSYLPKPANAPNPNNPTNAQTLFSAPTPKPKSASEHSKVDFGDTYANSLYAGLEREHGDLKALFDDPNADMDQLANTTNRFFEDSKLLSKHTDHLSQKGYGDEARQDQLGKGMDGLKGMHGDIAQQAIDKGMLGADSSLNAASKTQADIAEKLTESTKALESTTASLANNIGSAVAKVGSFFNR